MGYNTIPPGKLSEGKIILPMANVDFPQWLEEQLERKNWIQADLARASGITTAQIGRILNGARRAGPDACIAIADALNLPPDMVFRQAGLLPPKQEQPPEFEEINYILSNLPEEEREDILEYARLRARINERRDKYSTGPNLAET